MRGEHVRSRPKTTTAPYHKKRFRLEKAGFEPTSLQMPTTGTTYLFVVSLQEQEPNKGMVSATTSKNALPLDHFPFASFDIHLAFLRMIHIPSEQPEDYTAHM